MTAPRPRSPQPKQLDAGIFQAEISSFALRLPPRARPPRRSGPTPRRCSGSPPPTWSVRPTRPAGSRSASIQFRALRKFFKWLAAEDQIPDPMTRLRALRVAVRDVPVFTSGELSDLENACRGSTFAARHDAAIIAVFTATGIRLSELAGIRHKPGDPPAATRTCTPARSASPGRPASPAPSRSATRQPAASTATCTPATRRPGGPSCGSA